jgi:hypothetical protein
MDRTRGRDDSEERMAEIRIEQKRRGLGWLWLLLALVVVAVLAWYFLYPGRTTTAPAAAPPTTGALYRDAPTTHDGGGRAHGLVTGDGHHLGGWYGEQG